jgi:hypothetical protein
VTEARWNEFRKAGRRIKGAFQVHLPVSSSPVSDP